MLSNNRHIGSIYPAARRYGGLEYNIMTTGTIQAFLEVCRGRNLSPHTLRCYGQRLSYLAGYAKSLNKTVIELDKNDIRNYILSLNDNVSPVTINGRIRVFNVFYKFLVAEDIIEDTPMKQIGFVREPKRIMPIILPEQFSLVLKKFDRKSFTGYRDMCISLMCYDAMLRLDEVLSIKLDDIQLKPHRIVKVHGKGSKDRVVSFSSKTAAKLILYLNIYRKDISGDLLFPSLNGTKLDGTNIYRSFIKAAKSAGLKVKMGAHRLRHSGATEYLRKTGNIFLLKEILGHSCISTTTIYLHTQTKDIVETYEKNSPIAGLTI